MPKIFINCPLETFSVKAKSELVKELTTIALVTENLPNTPYIRSTVWIYINEYSEDNVYHGDLPGGKKVISVEVNTFKGGLTTASKKILIEKFTHAISCFAEIPANEVAPIYILIRNIDPSNWGIFGKVITLEDIRNSPPDAQPI